MFNNIFNRSIGQSGTETSGDIWGCTVLGFSVQPQKLIVMNGETSMFGFKDYLR